MTIFGKIPTAERDEDLFMSGKRSRLYIAGTKLMIIQVLAVAAGIMAILARVPDAAKDHPSYFLMIPGFIGGIAGLATSAVKSRTDSRADTLLLTGISVILFVLAVGTLLVTNSSIAKQTDISEVLILLVMFVFIDPLLIAAVLLLWLSMDRLLRLMARCRHCTMSATAYKHKAIMHDVEFAPSPRGGIRARHTGVFDKEGPPVYRYDTDDGSFYFSRLKANGHDSPENMDIFYDPEHPECYYIVSSMPNQMKFYRILAIISLIAGLFPIIFILT